MENVVSLGALIFQLKPLLQEPERNLDAIVELLSRHRDLAEYEVARFWVSQSLLPSLTQLARSADPRERCLAARSIRLVCTRRRAAQLLRGLVKDPDHRVRTRARHAVRALGIDDVALPDTRYRPPKRPSPYALGGYNPTGWSFGLYAGDASLGFGGHGARARAATRPSVLQKYALPALGSVAELARFLGLCSERELRRFLRPGSGRGSAYVEFSVEKSSGEPRTITAPRAALKRIQRKILVEILDKLPVHAACHGFVRGRSVASNAAPHVGARLVVKMDLRDFFPSIHYRRVAGLFRRLGYGVDVASALAGLTTHRGKLPDGTVLWPGVLPQGAPTSPALANLLCRRLDARLAGLCARAGGVYTRYADDLTFSFATPPDKGIGGFLWWVDQVCQQEGFTENTSKRRLLWSGGRQRVTGVVVNSGLHIPREARKNFRALLHNCRKDGLSAHARGRKDFSAYLRGFASYVKMVQPELGARLVAEVKELLRMAEK
jgi:hypothetical protein